jgi:WD40 repeat protein
MQREDAKCLMTIQCPQEKKTFNLVAISPDKKCIATTVSQTIYFYSLEGKLLHTIEKGHEDGTISSLVFSGDSSLFVTSTQSEHTAKVWKNPVNL